MTIETEGKKARLEKFLTVVAWLGILIHLGMFAVTNISGFGLYCDSDMYMDTLVAKYMWEEKSLFPKGWGFGNQLYVAATPVLAALFYGLTGSLNGAMILATETMTVFIVVSFLWLVRVITKDSLISACSCLLLIGSVAAPAQVGSYNTRLFFVQASYYACYLITLFVVYGDYVRSFQSQKLRPVALGLAMALSFAMGMQSLRQTVAMTLPMLVCEAFLALRRMICREKLWDSQIRGTALRVLCYTVANLGGVLVIKWMNIPQVNITGDMKAVPFGEIFGRLAPAADAFLKVTGLKILQGPETDIVYAIFALAMFAVCVAAGVIWVMKIKHPKTAVELCWLLCLVGIVGTMMSCVFFNVTIKERYLFLYYPLVAFSGLILLQKLPKRLKQLAALLMTLLCVGNVFHCQKLKMEVALLNDGSIAGKAFRLARDYGYHTLAWESQELTDARDLANWAVEEGYEYIYGEWSLIPHVAAQSDGKLVAGCWYHQGVIYQPVNFLNAQDIYGEEENAKAIYVFLPGDEEAGLQKAKERGVTLTKAAQFGDYRAYTSPVQLMGRESPGMESE